MIPFNKPALTGNEQKHILKSISSKNISGDGVYSKKCHTWFENKIGCKKALLTTSCTHAIEIAALLLDIKENDEIIMPSFTFVSTANAFVLRGAKIVFVDIRPDTMNIDVNKVESAITEKTKVIVPVHYAGVGCDMDKLLRIANKHNLYIVEDAAQGMMSSYKEKALGTIGDIGTYSFHETKNYTSAGEGGLLIINNEKFINRAEIIREKGTNRNQFFRGMVDKYSWVDLGSSYLMNDVSASYLWGNLEMADIINTSRLELWELYKKGLYELMKKGKIELPFIPQECKHNAHMFYIKVKDIDIRNKIISYLKSCDIMAIFHYIPLHTAPAGKKYGFFNGIDEYTTKESEKLLRLPLYYGLKREEVNYIVKKINYFYRNI